VVEAAGDLADELGYDRLTLAALAQHFEVAVPSLYKHIAGVDQLLAAVAAEAIAALGERLREATTRSPGRSLRPLAAAYREFAHRHPGRYAATVRAADPSTPAAVAAGESVLATVLTVLAEYGIEGEGAIDTTRAIRSALHGFVSLEAASGFGLPRDVDRSFGHLVAMLETALVSLAAASP
jgi:AcrR family transcriptional regulator